MHVLLFAAGEDFFANLVEHLHEHNASHESYADICDGLLYQGLVSQGFSSEPGNIAITFNTDGVPVFRSSEFSFWPLFLLINELPYRMR